MRSIERTAAELNETLKEGRCRPWPWKGGATGERRLSPRSWGASTPMKMCIQAVLDNPGALRHMNKNNSERPVCITHPLTPVSTSFLFVFDTEWVMSTCEHQGRDTVLQTGLKIHWSRRSASSCFNRVWRVTKSSAKHQSLLSPWVLQHQPWPSPSACPKIQP